MNSIPEMKPVMLQTLGTDFNRQDKSSPEKTEFASLVNKEFSKSTDNKSHQKENHSGSGVNEGDGANNEKPACNDCTSDIKNKMHNAKGDNQQQETDDIDTVTGDDENSGDEADSGKGVKTGALLFDLINGYMAEHGNTSQVSTGSGASETAAIGAGGSGSESVSGNGLKVGTLLNTLVSNYAADNEGGINPGPGSDQSTRLTGAGSSELPAGNGLKVGSVLNNPVSSYTAEMGEASLVNSGNEAGTESGEAGPDSHGENGLKIGELLNGPAEQAEESEINKDLIKEERASADKTININAEADDIGADKLNFKKEIAGQAEIKNEVSGHVVKNHSEDKVVDVKMPGNNNSEGLNSSLMSGSSDQFSNENGTGEHTFKFAKGPLNSGSDAESNNITTINTSNTTENARSVQGPSALHIAKTPGVQELLDNVIYVIKGNSKMGVSVEHENFGKLNISLSMEKGLVNVHINTSDRAVREIIENNIQHIIDTLNKDGVSVGEFSVGLRDQREHETNKFSLRNGQGREIPQEIKKEYRHSGLVNIFA